jgi:hypothetical protein
MKPAQKLIVTVLLCSVVFTLLMWAPFTIALSGSQLIRYPLIGAAMGGALYFLNLRNRGIAKKETKASKRSFR